jgi:hypothetical protein
MLTELILGDCAKALKRFPDGHFSAACFSPPYGYGRDGFDVRRDFRKGGRFLQCAAEISRVSVVWAVNFTQKCQGPENYPFLEELTLALREEGTALFDRWVLYKRNAKPARGQRALNNYEFVYLFSRYPATVLKTPGSKAMTCFGVRSHGKSLPGIGLTPFFPEIPRQVFRLYGRGWVLDPFAGTGTTLSVAREMGLNSVGVELDAKVFNLLKANLLEEE